MYFGLSVKEHLADNIIRHIPTKKEISINFAGSSISENGTNHLCKVLKPNKTHPYLLIKLNLKQTFPSVKEIVHISDALRLNHSL